jgi:hypothetical protein
MTSLLLRMANISLFGLLWYACAMTRCGFAQDGGRRILYRLRSHTTSSHPILRVPTPQSTCLQHFSLISTLSTPTITHNEEQVQGRASLWSVINNPITSDVESPHSPILTILFTEKRKAEAERIRQKYPDRIPVRCLV